MEALRYVSAVQARIRNMSSHAAMPTATFTASGSAPSHRRSLCKWALKELRHVRAEAEATMTLVESRISAALALAEDCEFLQSAMRLNKD